MPAFSTPFNLYLHLCTKSSLMLYEFGEQRRGNGSWITLRLIIESQYCQYRVSSGLSILSCKLLSLAQPKYCQWGLGQKTGRPCQSLDIMVIESSLSGFSCMFWIIVLLKDPTMTQLQLPDFLFLHLKLPDT